MTYLLLFLETLRLSAFTFGGGYVIVPLMRGRFCEKYAWFTDAEMLDMTAIAQSAPGPIAVNAAIIVGYKKAGVPGALLAMLGTVLPPLVIIAVVTLVYSALRDNRAVSFVMRGMQAGVAAVIANVVISMGYDIIKARRALPIIVMVLAFILGVAFKINVVLIILAAGVVGAIDAFIAMRRAAK